MSAVTSIKFRMYNSGSVGDCLLLLFMKGEQISFKMMIDCGGFNTNTAAMTPCVQDIKTTCNGEIDLLVVTHEHLDHVSGFNQARSVFDQIKVKEVWMSWIENPNDQIGKILKDKYGKKLAALKASTEAAFKQLKGMAGREYAVRGMKEKFGKKRDRIEDALKLIEFEEGKNYGSRMAVGRQSNGDAMDYVKAKAPSLKYRIPGQVSKDIPGAEGIKFFILGPPRDADMKFFKIVMKEEEMYNLAANSPSVDLSEVPEKRILNSGVQLRKGQSPFASEFQLDKMDLKNWWKKKYDHADYRWRQIETDWLEADAGIAMRVTNLTNNTSLAMALEFEGSGRVLLLPGDAQSGNWMGWHKPDVMQDLKDNGGKTTDDLLKNTIFYKVGHHGSHNGTASISGLDAVKSEDLVAFMPLVQDKVPEAWGGAENFPAPKLYQVLIDKTRGRLIRTDEGIVKDSHAADLRKKLTPQAKAEFESSFRKGPNYMEYTIKA